MHYDTLKKNRLITEFLGYKLAKCNNGFAWESPFQKAKDDYLGLHGRLYVELKEESPYSQCHSEYLKFHTSWEWLMPVALNLLMQYNIDCISKRTTIEQVFEDVVEAIEKINSVNGGYVRKERTQIKIGRTYYPFATLRKDLIGKEGVPVGEGMSFYKLADPVPFRWKKEEFEVYIQGKWRTAESIDWDF